MKRMCLKLVWYHCRVMVDVTEAVLEVMIPDTSPLENDIRTPRSTTI